MMGITHAIPSTRACLHGGSGHVKAVPACTPGAAITPVKHLIVEANGLYGYPRNWNVINQYLTTHLDMDHYLIHASQVNQKTQTFDGIDICGKRLAEEIQQVVQSHPELQYISMIGHSMGGLMLRYAAGRLYDEDEQRIAGLTPCTHGPARASKRACHSMQVHFISMATPHLGCDASEGEHQVPFVKWLGVTKFIAAALNHLSVPVTSFMFGISGQQLFMSEPEARAPGKGDRAGHEQQPPLLLRLAFDVPGEGRFFSALRLFRSRTCYGNADKDHLVGWANSTLRFTDELPVLDLRNRAGVPKARGVVLEDPPHSTATGRTTPAARRNSLAFACLGDELPTASGGDRSGGAASARVPVASTAGSGAAPAAPPAREQDSHVSQAVQHEFQGAVGGLQQLMQGPRAAQSAVVLQRLRVLGWSRVDCSWRDARLGAFAHNHIQVTRGWLNFEGRSVCDHLAKRFLQLEDGVAGVDREYTLPLTAARQAGSGILSSSGSYRIPDADQRAQP